jgi:hypothetical protein
MFFVAFQLEANDDLFFQQEVFEILESDAFDEGFPTGKTVLVLAITDGALQSLVVFSCLAEDLPDDLRLTFAFPSASDFVEN